MPALLVASFPSFGSHLRIPALFTLVIAVQNWKAGACAAGRWTACERSELARIVGMLKLGAAGRRGSP